MDQADIIHDLLNWLEGHLDHPLTLDNVAAKAGYSKWHLQRMFKDVTGQAIGAYIRARRLSNAAAALRLTSRPILDIALQYRFDSQQTFTRAFKNSLTKHRRCIAGRRSGMPTVCAHRSVWGITLSLRPSSSRCPAYPWSASPRAIPAP